MSKDEVSHQECPYPSCGSSDAFCYNVAKMTGHCKSCDRGYPSKEPMSDWAKVHYPVKDKGFVPKAIEEVDVFEVFDTQVKQEAGDYVPTRGITKGTMEYYKVKLHKDVPWKVQNRKTKAYESGVSSEYQFPYPSGGYKIRRIDLEKDHPAHFSASDLHADELFGQNLFSVGSSKTVTVTEGEYDAMAAYQMLSGGGYTNPVVSLPGATPNGKLWEKCKPWLDSFEKIVLSADNDKAGQALAERMSLMFPSKVFIMDHGSFKDANDFLINNKSKDFKGAWWAAKKFRPNDVLIDADDYLNLYDDSPDFEYFPTGVAELDEKILGICKGYFTVIQAPTGVGKSLAPDTKVLKADGSIIRADEVFVGDQLMGPDSKPRNVTNVNLQKGPMYRVTPVKGESFECNADHILSLKHTSTNQVKNVVLKEYLTWSKTQKHLWKLWRSGVTMFSPLGPNSPTLAYAVGAYLGDGRTQGPELCMGKHKQPVIDYMMSTGWLTPTRMRFDRGAYYIGFSTKDMLWDYVSNHTGQSEDCLTVRKIPDLMKRGYLETRKAVLAGLLDTDGSVTNGGAEITQKSEALSDDICFVARSLGLAAYKKSKWVNGVEYFRVGISGDMTIIPCKRLKFNVRKQNKDVLKTGFTVKPIGTGAFRGIALDGDHLFLLGDFTVTHNTEVMRYLEYQCLTTSNYTFAFMHLEESKLRSVLGLVSYQLEDNLTLKKFVDEKGREDDVRESIKSLTESERMIQFSYKPDDGYETLLDKIKYLVAAYGVDYVFFEPIQDLVTGTDKEGQLADLSSRLGTMASDIGVGIITIAHQNKDGDTMYASMIGKKAAFEIVLDRDQDAEDLTERNRTYIKVGRKNRVGLGNGPAGSFNFDHKAYKLKPWVGPNEPKPEKKEGIPFG